ncbi:hypothetical protein BDZ89DRAFT_647256 [Hymenopellis radicata]|nr:hypothetical protein BDZ89DRAFT_647256 [Hymenopellis radicata]
MELDTRSRQQLLVICRGVDGLRVREEGANLGLVQDVKRDMARCEQNGPRDTRNRDGLCLQKLGACELFEHIDEARQAGGRGWRSGARQSGPGPIVHIALLTPDFLLLGGLAPGIPLLFFIGLFLPPSLCLFCLSALLFLSLPATHLPLLLFCKTLSLGTLLSLSFLFVVLCPLPLQSITVLLLLDSPQLFYRLSKSSLTRLVIFLWTMPLLAKFRSTSTFPSPFLSAGREGCCCCEGVEILSRQRASCSCCDMTEERARACCSWFSVAANCCRSCSISAEARADSLSRLSRPAETAASSCRVPICDLRSRERVSSNTRMSAFRLNAVFCSFDSACRVSKKPCESPLLFPQPVAGGFLGFVLFNRPRQPLREKSVFRFYRVVRGEVDRLQLMEDETNIMDNLLQLIVIHG